MNQRWRGMAVLLAAVTCGCHGTAKSSPQPQPFSVPELGLRYTPPGGMEDRTPAAGLEARRHVTSNTSSVIQPLLLLTSPGEDTDRSWHNLALFAYPRAHWPQFDDDAVKQKVSTIIAGQASPVGVASSAVYGGHTFRISDFELKEGSLVRRANIYTTICGGQLVSFAFVSNSDDELKSMEKSMETLQLAKPQAAASGSPQ